VVTVPRLTGGRSYNLPLVLALTALIAGAVVFAVSRFL
jgi:hypothetical protein